MELSLFEYLLFFMGIVSIPLLWIPIISHSRNRAFVKRIKVLEELMDSKLVCTFSIYSPTTEICGKYKGRCIKFKSYFAGSIPLYRLSEFTLSSSKLPKRKRLMFDHHLVSENIRHEEDTLVYFNCADVVSYRTVLGKARATQILDELVDAAEKCESTGN